MQNWCNWSFDLQSGFISTVLEGPAAAVDQTFERIRQDDRHLKFAH